MSKVILSVVGHDRPGIIAAVSRVLFLNGCNIEDVSQSILQTEFAGLFIAALPKSLKIVNLNDRLMEALGVMGLSVSLSEMEPSGTWKSPPSEPFIITTMGADRPGLVAAITELLAGFEVNISNLKAVFRGGDNPLENTMIYEVDIPVALDHNLFREALYKRGGELGLDVSLQHREIFEAIHTV
ncbi:MAG: ACT domain-containing protein [Syntrophobacteraceae bacterium]|nr:ACT domain-containing protein [Syntrophobacteraceae bacterium]